MKGGSDAAASYEVAKQHPANNPTIKKKDVAGVFIFGHERSGVAGLDVYKTRRSTNDESFKIQGWSDGRILGG